MNTIESIVPTISNYVHGEAPQAVDIYKAGGISTGHKEWKKDSQIE